MNEPIYAVIMAGGGGTRFWPLSRQTKPKQLLNLTGRDTLINETIDRVLTLCDRERIFIVTNEEQVPEMRRAIGKRLLPEHILAEPAARNTAACIGYAALTILEKYGDGVMCVFPSDHYIKNEAEFTRVLKNAAEEAAETEALLTVGITPTTPHTGYGYICFDRGSVSKNGAHPVIRFREKPDEETAKSYLASGDYVWNAGMFVWKASVILQQMEACLPEVYAKLMELKSVMNTPEEDEALHRIYPEIPSVSVDYGIMEKSRDVKVIFADMGWNDVGTWDNLGALYDEDENGNIFVGEHASIDTKNTVTWSKKKLVATLGVEDLIIVETGDALLVCDRRRAQEIRLLPELLKREGRTELL